MWRSKSKLITILCMALALSSHAQVKPLSVSGKIMDVRTHEGLPNVTVKLAGSDYSQLTMRTDSTGNYFFANCFQENASYILRIDAATITGTYAGVTYGTCGHAFYEDHGYMQSSERYTFKFSDSIRDCHHDFLLNPYYQCYITFPDFLFKKNSSDFEKAGWMEMQSADSAADCFTALLIAKKNWRIEITGHASKDEKDPKALAAARAKKFADLLVNKGIELARITYISVSDKIPYEIKDENGLIIKNKKPTNEQNRRISLSVISKDYTPK